jgi:hypothetical protein
MSLEAKSGRFIMRSDEMFEITRRIFLYLIPVLALFGLAIPVILGMHNLSLLGSYLAIPMLLGTIVFLKFRDRIYEEVRLNERLFYLFPAAYFFLFALSELMLDIFDLRQIEYYMTVTLMSTVILLEILLFKPTKGKVLLILAQIMALNLNLIWGVTMKYYLFIGRTDPIAHIYYLSTLIETAHVTDAFDNYRAFPLWHILVCILYLIIKSPLPMEKMIFFANGLVYAVLIPMTYMVSRKAFKDISLALLISLMIIFFTDTIVYGMSSIPRSVVSFLELLLLFFIFSTNSIKSLMVCVALIPILIMYHPVSMLFILVLFIMLIIMDLVFRNDEQRVLSKKYFFLVLVVCLGYYIYYSTYIFQSLLENVVGTMPTMFTAKGISGAPLEEVINYLQHVPLIFFIVFGILWVLGDKIFSIRARILCILGIITSVVSFPGPVMLLTAFAKEFNIMRFGEYAFIFIIMIAAVGFSGLFHKARRYGRLILVIIFMAMVLLSVSNDFTASDNPLVKRIFYTFYMTEEEANSMNYLCNISEGLVMSDQVAARYIECSPYQEKSQILEVDINNLSILTNSDKDLLLIRAGELKQRPLKLFKSSGNKFILKPSIRNRLNYFTSDLPIWCELNRFNRIYDSGNIWGLGQP